MAQNAYETSKKAIIQLLEAEERILLALLFGSVAKGQTTPMSDIDIAVYWDPLHVSDKSNLLQLSSKLSNQLEDTANFDPIQVTHINNNSPEIRFHIFKHRIIIKCVSERLLTKLHYEAVRDYLDTQYIRDVRAEITRRNIYARV